MKFQEKLERCWEQAQRLFDFQFRKKDMTTFLLCPDSSSKTEFKINLICQRTFQDRRTPKPWYDWYSLFLISPIGNKEKDMKIAEFEGKDHK